MPVTPRIRIHAIFALNERHNFFASEIWRSDRRGRRRVLATLARRVFDDARFAGVVDADDDERLDGADADQVVGGAMHIPVLASEAVARSKRFWPS